VSFIIYKNTANTICPTLKEKCVSNSGFYLFQFSNSTGNYYCISNDIGAYPARNNKFVITDMPSPNNLIGQINLATGEYEYTIYENTSNTNLSPTGLTVVEVGDVFVEDSTSDTDKEYSNGYINNKVYTPS